MDVVTLVLAGKKANAYTDTKIAGLGAGLTYKGSVASQSALPATATKGDCYNVTDGSGMFAWDGSAWGSCSWEGPQGETGTSAGFGTPTATVDSNVGTPQVTITASGPDTAKVFAFDFKNLKGTPGTNSVSVSATGTSTNKVKYITIDGTESKMSTDVVNNVTSTSTEDALSANMGKELQDQISNLKNIGRFLAIWNSATGLPLTNPTTLPYTYKTGDYYRVGTVAASGGTNYKPDGATYTGAASTTVETEDVEVSYVYYYDGTNWLAQSAGGGGTVQDVQINGTSILSAETGVADIPIATGTTVGVLRPASAYGTGIVASSGALTGMANSTYSALQSGYASRLMSKYDVDVINANENVKFNASQSLTTAQQLQARTNIGAGTPYTVTVDI